MPREPKGQPRESRLSRRRPHRIHQRRRRQRLLEASRVEPRDDPGHRRTHAGDEADLMRQQIVERIAHRRHRLQKAAHRPGLQQMRQCRLAVRREFQRIVLTRRDGGQLGTHLALDHGARLQHCAVVALVAVVFGFIL